jgi:hypothetical protein
LLEGPFNEVLESDKPDFPFCLGWANHSWYAKNWNASDTKKDKLLIEQAYPGEEDHTNHFLAVLKAFKDRRYLTIDEKPIFFIYSALTLPDVRLFIDLWQKLAKENGLNGIYFIGQARVNSDCSKILNLGFDGICRTGIEDAVFKIRGKYTKKVFWYIKNKILNKRLNLFKYSDIIKNLLVPELDLKENIFPTIVPNFDHSPRSGKNGLIYVGSTPELFRRLLKATIDLVKNKKEENKIIFLRSWNEWAEGNYVEPDKTHKDEYLAVLKSEIKNN